mgnify:CR=1 FL=1
MRVLIPDMDPSNPIFGDGDLAVFLTLANQKVFLATALALETVATDETLVYKIVTTDDMSVNGVTGAVQVLLARAKTLRADQDKADSAADAQYAFNLVFPASPFDVWGRPEATAWPC